MPDPRTSAPPAGPATEPAGVGANRPSATEERRLLADAALAVFELNGQFLGIANDMASAAGLTATRWQVLGAIMERPMSVAEIARAMGMTRQGVQRVADDVVGAGLAEYRDNPAHKRAKLLARTAAGNAAVRRISPGHARVASALADDLGVDRLGGIVAALKDLSAAIDRVAEVAERERPDATRHPGR